MNNKSLLHNLNSLAETLEKGNYIKEASQVTKIMQRVAFGKAPIVNKMIDNVMQAEKGGRIDHKQTEKALSPLKGKIDLEDAKMPEPMDIDTPCENEGCLACSEGPIVKETHIFLSTGN